MRFSLQPENDDRWGIRLQLHPQRGNSYLPADVTLALLSWEGETLREVTSESLDNFIQLPRFKCDRGESFSIIARLEHTVVRQDFMV